MVSVWRSLSSAKTWVIHTEEESTIVCPTMRALSSWSCRPMQETFWCFWWCVWRPCCGTCRGIALAFVAISFLAWRVGAIPPPGLATSWPFLELVLTGLWYQKQFPSPGIWFQIASSLLKDCHIKSLWWALGVGCQGFTSLLLFASLPVIDIICLLGYSTCVK